MDPPFGHVGHHHHSHHSRRDNDDDDNYFCPPPPPPPFGSSPYPPPQTYPPPSYGGPYDAPQPPGMLHSSHHPPPHLESQTYPPPHLESQNYPPPPSFHHQSSHGYGHVEQEEERPHHSFRPHMPGFIQEHFHHNNSSHNNFDYSGPTEDGGSIGGGPHLDSLANKPSHKIYCKAGGDRYTIGIREGKLVLTHPDHDDPTQHWFKDERYSTRVKDKDGYPSFILVNKGTGQAVKHSISCHPVQLVPYKPDVFDESVLWTEGKDRGSGFRTIRTVNNVKLVMDAWNADKDHGGIHDGTVIALFDVWKGDNQNQQWKIVPF